jgi:apolipoprotein D and lipocalin family protein
MDETFIVVFHSSIEHKCVVSGDKMSELKTVEHVDVVRYMGTWFEIAKFPQRFEKGLVGITANYTLLPDGKVRVLNSGYKGDFNGKLKTTEGKAWVVDTATNAKLKVCFFWPFAGNYWILELGKDYEYVVVGEASRKYLWILSRTPQMDEAVYNGLIQRVRDMGFDISKIEKNPQKPASGN